MGKKSKQKKQRQQQMSQNGKAAVAAAAPAAANQVSTGATRATGLELGEQFIRRDIMRILLLIGGIAVILIALSIIDMKSSVLLDAGKRLASFLGLA